MHQASIEKFGNKWNQPGKLVVNGTFVLSSRVVNEKLELVPNPHYWDKAHRVQGHLHTDQSGEHRHQSLSGGGSADHRILPQEQYDKLMKEIPGEVHTPMQLGTYYYAFNTRHWRLPSPTCGSRSWAPKES